MSNSVPVIRCTEARHSILEYAHFNVICVRCLRYDQVNLNSHNGNNYGSSYLHTAHMQLDRPSDTGNSNEHEGDCSKNAKFVCFWVRLTFIANKFEYSVFKFSRFSRCWMPRGAIRPILEQVAKKVKIPNNENNDLQTRWLLDWTNRCNMFNFDLLSLSTCISYRFCKCCVNSYISAINVSRKGCRCLSNYLEDGDDPAGFYGLWRSDINELSYGVVF